MDLYYLDGLVSLCVVPPIHALSLLRCALLRSSLFFVLVLLPIQTYLTGVRLSFQEVEKLIVKAVKQRQVKVTVDHKVSSFCHSWFGPVLLVVWLLA